MRRARRIFRGETFMLPDQSPYFKSKKERDAYEGHPLNREKPPSRQASKLPKRVTLFSDRINTLIAEGKVKVYYSMKEFKNRKHDAS